MAAHVALLRGVRGVHYYDPPAVLRHVVSEPLNKLSTIPPTVLHSIANPTQIFYSHYGIAPHMREVSYLLCGENSQLPLFTGS